MEEILPTQPIQPPQSPTPPIMPEKKSNGGLIVILLIAILLIGAGGVYAGMKLSGKLIALLFPKPTPTTISQPTKIPTLDETANWKTYKSDKYNFEVKYPQNWSLNLENKVYNNGTGEVEKELGADLALENKNDAQTCGPYECYPSIYFLSPIKNNSKIEMVPKEWAKKFFVGRKLISTSEALNSLVFSESRIGDSQAVEVEFLPGRKYVFIFKENNVYIAIVELINSKNIDNYYSLFDQILSTFKFLP